MGSNPIWRSVFPEFPVDDDDVNYLSQIPIEAKMTLKKRVT